MSGFARWGIRPAEKEKVPEPEPEELEEEEEEDPRFDEQTRMSTWFMCGLPRAAVLERTKELSRTGEFIVRDVKSDSEAFGLTVRMPDQSIGQFHIKEHQKRGWYVRGTRLGFETVSKLIRYYSDNYHDELGVQLLQTPGVEDINSDDTATDESDDEQQNGGSPPSRMDRAMRSSTVGFETKEASPPRQSPVARQSPGPMKRAMASSIRDPNRPLTKEEEKRKKLEKKVMKQEYKELEKARKERDKLARQLVKAEGIKRSAHNHRLAKDQHARNQTVSEWETQQMSRLAKADWEAKQKKLGFAGHAPDQVRHVSTHSNKDEDESDPEEPIIEDDSEDEEGEGQGERAHVAGVVTHAHLQKNSMMPGDNGKFAVSRNSKLAASSPSPKPSASGLAPALASSSSLRSQRESASSMDMSDVAPLETPAQEAKRIRAEEKAKKAMEKEQLKLMKKLSKNPDAMEAHEEFDKMTTLLKKTKKAKTDASMKKKAVSFSTQEAPADRNDKATRMQKRRGTRGVEIDKAYRQRNSEGDGFVVGDEDDNGAEEAVQKAIQASEDDEDERRARFDKNRTIRQHEILRLKPAEQRAQLIKLEGLTRDELMRRERWEDTRDERETQARMKSTALSDDLKEVLANEQDRRRSAEKFRQQRQGSAKMVVSSGAVRKASNLFEQGRAPTTDGGYNSIKEEFVMTWKRGQKLSEADEEE